MGYVVRNLTDDEMAAIAVYYAQQKEGLTPLD
jgi:cytochrome c553